MLDLSNKSKDKINEFSKDKKDSSHITIEESLFDIENQIYSISKYKFLEKRENEYIKNFIFESIDELLNLGT